MRRLRGAERTQVAAGLAARYEAGASIRQLAAETSRSYWQVRTLLVEAGETLRPRGGPRKDGW
jgi:hypothetical protein